MPLENDEEAAALPRRGPSSGLTKQRGASSSSSSNIVAGEDLDYDVLMLAIERLKEEVKQLRKLLGKYKALPGPCFVSRKVQTVYTDVQVTEVCHQGTQTDLLDSPPMPFWLKN